MCCLWHFWSLFFPQIMSSMLFLMKYVTAHTLGTSDDLHSRWPCFYEASRGLRWADWNSYIFNPYTWNWFVLSESSHRHLLVLDRSHWHTSRKVLKVTLSVLFPCISLRSQLLTVPCKRSWSFSSHLPSHLKQFRSLFRHVTQKMYLSSEGPLRRW
jgi:hypothetical protein